MPVDDATAQLISRCLGGDQAAYETLYRSSAGRVAGYFSRSGFDPAQTDDLTQETFLRAFRSLGGFDANKGAFPAWVATIARNVARRHWRRRAGEDTFDPELADVMFPSPQRPDRTPEAREEFAAVGDCVESLDAELGRIVRLRYVRGLTTRGIAREAGMPEATVRSRLEDALKRLARCLKSKGFLE